MHDGYIFTLGICGSASPSNPAPALLDAMLAALPPVKRAALLGEIVPLDGAGKLHDPLLDPIIQDLRDAEVILMVTPLASSGRLPARLAALVKRAAPLVATGVLHGKVAVLVGVVAAADMPAGAAPAQLQRFCDEAGIAIADMIILAEPAAADAAVVDRLKVSAQRAYALARQRVAYALP